MARQGVVEFHFNNFRVGEPGRGISVPPIFPASQLQKMINVASAQRSMTLSGRSITKLIIIVHGWLISPYLSVPLRMSMSQSMFSLERR